MLQPTDLVVENKPNYTRSPTKSYTPRIASLLPTVVSEGPWTGKLRGRCGHQQPTSPPSGLPGPPAPKEPSSGREIPSLPQDHRVGGRRGLICITWLNPQAGICRPLSTNTGHRQPRDGQVSHANSMTQTCFLGAPQMQPGVTAGEEGAGGRLSRWSGSSWGPGSPSPALPLPCLGTHLCSSFRDTVMCRAWPRMWSVARMSAHCTISPRGPPFSTLGLNTSPDSSVRKPMWTRIWAGGGEVGNKESQPGGAAAPSLPPRGDPAGRGHGLQAVPGQAPSGTAGDPGSRVTELATGDMRGRDSHVLPPRH